MRLVQLSATGETKKMWLGGVGKIALGKKTESTNMFANSKNLVILQC
jgi:hypothetical protein